jgi:hypothetical protein
MSDVTGNLGGESIRLRGMALEDTQSRIFEKIEDLLEVNKKMAKAQGVDTNNLQRSAGKLTSIFSTLSDDTGNTSSNLKEVSKVTKILNSAMGVLSSTIGATVRTVRGMDSNIDDASFAIRSVSQELRGTAGEVAKFAADSVNQLQEQYRAFKQMSDISGVMSSGFDNLRETSARVNLSMEQYSGLMQENFINLRTGGNLVYKSMERLQKGVEELNNDKELPFVFQRLGINANDYAKIILQQTALNRGLNRSLDTYSEGFAKSMQRSVTNAIGLADAFGIQRNIMLDAQRKAQEDVMFAKMFDNLDVEGPVKEMMFQLSLALTGGDIEKAKKLTISQFTGVATDTFRELSIVGGGEILASMESTARAIAKNPEDMANQLASIQEKFKKFDKAFGGNDNLLRFMADPNSPGREGFTILFDAARKFAGPDGVEAMREAMIKGAEAAKDGTKSQLDSLGMLQRENIKTAVIAAQANQALNGFGLTLAHGMQIISSLLVSVAGGTVGTISNDRNVQAAISKLTELSNQGVGFMTGELHTIIKEQTELALAGMNQVINRGQQTSATSSQNTGRTTTQTAASAPTFLGSTADNPITVKTTTSGQTQRIPVHKLDEVSGQYNQGGRAHPSINQLLGVLSGASDITVTGINDAYGGRGANSSHNRGLAVDFTIPGGSAAYSKKYDFVYNQLRHGYGLDPAKGDFKIFDEANFPFGHTKGAHMHVEFSEQGAAKFQKAFEGLQGASGPGGGTNNTMTPPPAAASTATSSSAAPAATTTSQAATADGATNAVAMMGSSVNNSTSNLVAIADEDMSKQFDTMISLLSSTKTEISNLRDDLVRAV